MEYTTLDKICKNLDYIRKPITGKDRIEGNIPYYGASGVVDYVRDYIFDEELLLISEDGANLLARTTPIAFSIKGKTWVNNHAHVLRFNDKKLQRFVELYLNRINLESFITGTAQPKLNQKMLNSIPIPIMDNEEIGIIVQLMEKLQTIIVKRAEETHKLDDLIKARFVELFGDCRLNPKEWKTVALGDIAEVGSSKRVFVEELKKDGIPFFRGTEVGALAEGKKVIPELFITEEHYDELIKATGKPELGDLLMPSICPDGRIWVVDTDEPFYFKDGRVLWVHGIDKKFDPVFLLYTLKDRIMTDYSSIASGTTFAELKIFALKQCQVFDVPIEEQRGFAAFIAQIDKSKVIEKQAS